MHAPIASAVKSLAVGLNEIKYIEIIKRENPKIKMLKILLPYKTEWNDSISPLYELSVVFEFNFNKNSNPVYPAIPALAIPKINPNAVFNVNDGKLKISTKTKRPTTAMALYNLNRYVKEAS